MLQGQLLVFIKNAVRNDIGEMTSSGQALLALTYLALFLSISAAMSSLVLTDELGSVHLRAARAVALEGNTVSQGSYDEAAGELLTRFNGGRGSWRWVMWHCKSDMCAR